MGFTLVALEEEVKEKRPNEQKAFDTVEKSCLSHAMQCTMTGAESNHDAINDPFQLRILHRRHSAPARVSIA